MESAKVWNVRRALTKILLFVNPMYLVSFFCFLFDGDVSYHHWAPQPVVNTDTNHLFP